MWRRAGNGTGGTVAARHVARALLAASALQLAFLPFAEPAHAFKLFGITLFGSKEESEPVLDPVNYSVTLTAPEANKALVKKLRAASALVADEKKPVSGAVGLMTKARNDREILIATLYQEARYDGVVDIAIAGRDLDALPPDTQFDRSKPVPVVVTVHPGRVFHLGTVTLVGGAAGLDPAKYGLVMGGDAGSETVLKAEKDIVTALKARGHPYARVTDREIVADHATHRLDVRLTFATGPVAAFGDIRVTGTGAVKSDFVAYMADIGRGKTYSPKTLSDARDRLLALDVFDSVRVAPADKLAADGSLPVDIAVTEKKPHFLGIGASLSSIDGAGFEGYWGRRNLFGRAERLKIEGSISGIGSNDLSKLNYDAGITFTKPGVVGARSKLTAGLKLAYEHPDAYDKLSAGGGVVLAYGLDEWQTVSGGAGLEWSRIDDTFGRSTHLLASLPLEYVFDNRNDKFNPTRGYRFVADVMPAHDFLAHATFLKLKGQAQAYRAIDAAGRVVLAGRIAAGTIVGASLADIVADQRFYAGGGGSVRGYAYQGIGPMDASGTPTGGRSLVETSLELRFMATEKIGIVPFVDGGSVTASETPDFSNLRFGAGLGLRYMTSFGPLRVDAAVPLNRHPGDSTFGLYAGIGQAF